MKSQWKREKVLGKADDYEWNKLEIENGVDVDAEKTHLSHKRFYWPYVLYIQQEIENYVTKRCVCIKQKRSNVLQKAQVRLITTSAPFELL